VRNRIQNLQKTVASSFDVVKAQCLPFSVKGVIVEEMIHWIAEEIKAVPNTVLWVNDNFATLGVFLVCWMGEWFRPFPNKKKKKKMQTIFSTSNRTSLHFSYRFDQVE
jgi:hypothetical protein